jgi:hypothetical protein
MDFILSLLDLQFQDVDIFAHDLFFLRETLLLLLEECQISLGVLQGGLEVIDLLIKSPDLLFIFLLKTLL